MKILIVTGGVMSGLGKGVTVASIGFLLNSKKNIVVIKLDGYLNCDPGTMNPKEHGEVFVLEDGGEVDMDFGHYERFLNTNCNKEQNITMGKIYNEIWKRERNGFYLGKTVQLIPHVTDLIKEKILEIGKKYKADILIVEIGGTVGDMETELFIESIRQLKMQTKKKDIIFLHLTYVPIPYGVKEQKTKPTQQSIKLLKERGINPDIILARCNEKLTKSSIEKISMFSNIKVENIFSAIDVDNIYKLPILFKEQGLEKIICKKFSIALPINKRYDFLKTLIEKEKKKNIKIAIAGKYTSLEDSYASIYEAIRHCEMFFSINVEIVLIDTSKDINFEKFKDIQGIIVPGGFGSRGSKGKIEIINYARKNDIAFLGICYGMQLCVIEFARNVCNLNEANSTEIDNKTKYPVVSLLDSQKNIINKGGTMRLGGYEAILEDSKIKKLYKKLGLFKIKNKKFIISERHRHRFEVNPQFHKILEENGLKIVGKSQNGLAEFIEVPSNKYFVATQGHPELKSKPDKPSPLFYGLFESILK